MALPLEETQSAPVLHGEAVKAVMHRGSHMQIIAAAGSGKTEVVSQRIAELLAEDVPPAGIVAFTFTERAADELKNRVGMRVQQRIGPDALDRLGGLFIGTIHAYSFRLLQQRVPQYETYDVLDENRLAAFLAREATRLKIRDLDPKGRMFAAIQAFLHSVDVVENELLDPYAMPDPFGHVLLNYLATLDRYRLLTYGQQIVRAVRELERREVQAAVHQELRHLVVDEYQDVNPAQERLIELLAGPKVELCVVGDDDQAIYQWRGSDVSNIVEFDRRYANVAQFRITTNRRSKQQIVSVANRFARTIPERLTKKMTAHRQSDPADQHVVVWSAPTETEEAGWIAKLILDLHEQGVPFRDIALLVRSRAAYRRLIEEFATFGIPVQPGGRTGLFDQAEARLLGQTIAWLTDTDWRTNYGPGESVAEDDLLDEYLKLFSLPSTKRPEVRRVLRGWRTAANDDDRRANLVGELYDLLDVLGVKTWDLDDPLARNRLGTLARFSALLADFESVRQRARPDHNVEGEQVGGDRGGTWYYRNLAYFILNHAAGAYDGFDGEPDFDFDAVDLTTVHRAKGLEWPVVFVPSMTANRFPPKKTGQRQDWLVPRHMFRADRYEGSDADERRLFYVAITRARDWCSISRHCTPGKQRVRPSPYFQELTDLEVDPPDIFLPAIEVRHFGEDEPITLTYSELAQFLDCGMEYRLRNLFGFQPRLVPELGYGKAVHHVLRTVAEHTRATGRVPSAAELDGILDAGFFLPTANKAAHRELKKAARRLIGEYARRHRDDLHRIWETERPFELHLDGVTVTGRADVILDREGGVPTALAIVDYKTRTDGEIGAHGLQLQVYADAGQREGLDVRGAYVHDLKAIADDRDNSRMPVDVSAEALAAAEATVSQSAERLRAHDYEPNPGRRCGTCEVRTICRAANRTGH